MLVFLGLVLFLAAAAAVLTAVLGDTSAVSFDAVGHHFAGVDAGLVFAVGAGAGLALALGAWLMHRGTRLRMAAWRERRRIRRSQAALRAENARLAAELERTRAEAAYPADPGVPTAAAPPEAEEPRRV